MKPKKGESEQKYDAKYFFANFQGGDSITLILKSSRDKKAFPYRVLGAQFGGLTGSKLDKIVLKNVEPLEALKDVPTIESLTIPMDLIAMI